MTQKELKQLFEYDCKVNGIFEEEIWEHYKFLLKNNITLEKWWSKLISKDNTCQK
jgi:hypothetical protein